MTHLSEPNNILAYRIKVRGRLKESWSDWFNGMTIEARLEADGAQVTTLTGLVRDQTALHGLLDKIRDLGLPLLSLEQVDPNQDGTTQRS